MDLKNETLSTMYEGINPTLYSEFTAKKLNILSRQLLENDQALLVEAERVKLLSTENKNKSDANESGLTAAGSRISALEAIERLKVEDLNISAPLNVNGFLIGGLTLGPVGYSGAGNCVVSAVSSYTKGFQGSYGGSSPASAATTKDAATVTNKFFYGAWNTGPRTEWGGLGGGNNTPVNSYRPTSSSTTNVWQSDASKEGCLLRIHKPSGGEHDRNNACLVTMKYFCNTRKVRFQAYVWVDSGPKTFKFGPVDPKGTITVTNLKEWTPVDVVVTTNGSTGKYWRIILETNSEQTIYIAMLGIYPLTGKAVGNTLSTINTED